MHIGPAALAFTGGALVYGSLTGQVANTYAQWQNSANVPTLQRIQSFPRSVRLAGAGAVCAGFALAGWDKVADGLALLIILMLVINLGKNVFGGATAPTTVSGGATPQTGNTATA